MSVKRPVKAKKTLSLDPSEKYQLYESSVQCPDFEVDFFTEKYQYFYSRPARVFREDFCGTGYLTCEWVKSHPRNKGIGLDLDLVPLTYGRENHLTKLTPQQRKRVELIQGNVLSGQKHKADIIAALNFSYFIFKERKDLLNYFKSVRKSLTSKGAFFLDLFGGTQCSKPIVDRVEHKKFIYYWDCESFNPISNHCLYKIHYKLKSNNQKYKDVFTYDWRMWSLPEIHDLLADAGFSRRFAFWEGDNDEGRGDGNFQITTEAENCDSWICYLAALP